jgi:hypothetical protein
MSAFSALQTLVPQLCPHSWIVNTNWRRRKPVLKNGVRQDRTNPQSRSRQPFIGRLGDLVYTMLSQSRRCGGLFRHRPCVSSALSYRRIFLMKVE